MEDALMLRDSQGKFAQKNDEYRCVRSLRLTDTTWTALGALAESLSLTRGDYLEQIFRNQPDSLPGNTRLEKELLPSNTRKNSDSQPSNIWQKEQTERLLAEVAQLREENASLSEQIQAFTQADNLEAMRDHIVTRLKLGKQALGYKKALSALNQFIQLQRDKFSSPTDVR